MKRTTILLLLFMAVLLAACGGNSEPDAEPVSMTIKGYDTFAFDPESFSIPAGSEVTLIFENAGGLDHNFVLVRNNADPLLVSDADAVGGVNAGIVSGGGESTLTFIAPPPGEYQFVCTIAGHAAGGMVGTMVVEN